ncbi:hypothetical protein P8610_02145 [Fictibacillus sp. UD]
MEKVITWNGNQPLPIITKFLQLYFLFFLLVKQADFYYNITL